MQYMGRMIHLCLQSAIDMWVDGGAATKLHSFAEIISSFIAKIASAAVNAGLNGHAVTDFEVIDAASDCCNDTGSFVT